MFPLYSRRHLAYWSKEGAFLYASFIPSDSTRGKRPGSKASGERPKFRHSCIICRNSSMPPCRMDSHLKVSRSGGTKKTKTNCRDWYRLYSANEDNPMEQS